MVNVNTRRADLLRSCTRNARKPTLGTNGADESRPTFAGTVDGVATGSVFALARVIAVQPVRLVARFLALVTGPAYVTLALA